MKISLNFLKILLFIFGIIIQINSFVKSEPLQFNKQVQHLALRGYQIKWLEKPAKVAGFVFYFAVFTLAGLITRPPKV